MKSPTETSTSSASGVTPEDPEVQPAEPATLSWRERAKTFAMEYGPVGIGTHAVLSILSFSTIYIGISSGIDVSKLLSAIGLESQAHSAAASSAGSFLMAYTIYKLMSPVRWPLTFAVTPVVMRALRRRGYMLPKAPVTPSRSDSSNE
ncbi:TPA: hypothetical protein N0F65_008667 [Lagenidium giganteum]|uniref:DUF1279 domain-containing protein n=1 Tax=Lagenidium giganteum TaxID=4803 RepID=A0AAV2Z657_9STRA|nr:TPA: hypothetical protein N0F65_008667 [Lagenidium giganteum]